MNDVIHIPEEYTFTFKRMINGLPEHLRSDPKTLQTLMAFFKLGGKSLAQQWVEVQGSQFEERVILSKRKILTESDLEEEDMAEGEDGEDMGLNDELEDDDEMLSED